MIDKWVNFGHKLGECFFEQERNITYIHIPKNASSFAKQLDKVFKYSDTFIPADKYLILLREPIERWLSGMSQTIQSASKTNWNDDLIFDTITFNDHSEEQVYFLRHIDLEKDLDRCIFFNVDESFTSKFNKWVKELYPEIKLSSVKLNVGAEVEGRIDIVNKLRSSIDNNPDYLLKLKQHFAKDYELYQRVKFYD